MFQVVIELDKKNEKAWFRRGQACMKLKDWEGARESFVNVSELSGKSNKEGNRLLRECDQQLGERRDKEKMMYREMFQSKAEA
jgi:FK506-binding protein 4/5